jgi:hypothetical protein
VLVIDVFDYAAFLQVRESEPPGQLLAYQVGGSSSRRRPNWILIKANDIADIELLDQIFPGGRPTASGKHLKWDKLFIRVKPVADHQAGSA